MLACNRIGKFGLLLKRFAHLILRLFNEIVFCLRLDQNYSNSIFEFCISIMKNNHLTGGGNTSGNY